MFERFETPVRCAAGHLFTTIWVPGGSVKAVRLGWTRWQFCPVGQHWTTVSRLDEADRPPTADELAQAALVHDVRVP